MASRPTHNQLQRTVGCLAAVGVIAAGAVGCGDRGTGTPTSTAPPPVVVGLAPARVEPVARTIDVVGTLAGDVDTTLAAKVPGRVLRVLKDVGDAVGPGEAAVELDPADFVLARDQAAAVLAQTLARLGVEDVADLAGYDPSALPSVRQAALQRDNAAARLRRSAELLRGEPPLISEQDFADLRTAADAAARAYDTERLVAAALVAEAKARQVDLRARERAVADTTVRAPAAEQLAAAGGPPGAATRPTVFRVAARHATVGRYVAENADLVRLVSDDPLKLRVQVPETDLSRVAVGQRAEVRLHLAGAGDGSEMPAATGAVYRINPQVNPANRSFEVEVLVPNPGRTLRPGSFARASIVTREDPAVTFVPLDAVVGDAGLTKVFTVAGGVARQHVVRTGRRRGDAVEVVEGLAAPADVIVSGAARLSDGAAVEPRAAGTTAPSQSKGGR